MRDASARSSTRAKSRAGRAAPLRPTTLNKPTTTRADILIAIKPVYMERIAKQTKNHEFRKYLIPTVVQRFWLYVSSPEQTLKYIAVVSHGKRPGEIEKENGIGNADFNAGLKKDVAAYAYEIKELYELREPLPLATMQERYQATFPQKYSYVSQKMLDDIPLETQIRLF